MWSCGRGREESVRGAKQAAQVAEKSSVTPSLRTAERIADDDHSVVAISEVMVKKTSIAALSEVRVGMHGASSRVWLSRPAMHDSGTVRQLGSGIVSSFGHVLSTTSSTSSYTHAGPRCHDSLLYDMSQVGYSTESGYVPTGLSGPCAMRLTSIAMS